MTDDLAAWLTQVWDEDEAAARAATPGPWRYNPEKHTRLPAALLFEEAVFAGPTGAQAITIAATGETDDPQSMVDAAYIARHDPAAELARIAADRQILELHGGAHDCQKIWTGTYPGGEWRHVSDEHFEDLPCPTVRLLALPHADRPGYQEAWRPA